MKCWKMKMKRIEKLHYRRLLRRIYLWKYDCVPRRNIVWKLYYQMSENNNYEQILGFSLFSVTSLCQFVNQFVNHILKIKIIHNKPSMNMCSLKMMQKIVCRIVWILSQMIMYATQMLRFNACDEIFNHLLATEHV